MKVLVLAYEFPPLISVACQRPYSWFKYFPNSGMDVSIITRHWTEGTAKPEDYVNYSKDSVFTEVCGANRIVRSRFSPNLRDKFLLRYGLDRYTLLRKVMSFFYSIMEHMSYSFDSKADVCVQAEKYLKENEVDIIVATGGPFLLFKYANHLSKKYHVPWVADYRDGWTTNQGGYRNSIFDKLLNNFFKYVEKKYVQSALLITTAAPSYAEDLKKIHPNKDIRVIYNGYFEEYHVSAISNQNENKKFIITYTGTIYPYQKIETFLAGLKHFLQRNSHSDIVLNFYGLNPGVKERILAFDGTLTQYLSFHNRVSHQESIELIRSSNLLLLLSSQNANTLATKVFDYLASRRQIILVENDFGVLDSILKQTNGGVSFITPSEIGEFIAGEYKRYKENECKNFTVSSHSIEMYSRRKQSELFADLLKEKINWNKK